MLDFIRIVCGVPAVRVGDVEKNAGDICTMIEEADKVKADVLLLPELCLTGYTCGDLFFQDTLYAGVRKGLRRIADCSGSHPELTCVLGVPVRVGTRLYNCAAVISRGEITGLVPKTHLTATEKRWFASGAGLHTLWLEPEQLGLTSSEDYFSIPLQADQLFCLGEDAVVGIEICEDMMVPQPRSASLAVNGAEIILNLSASPEAVGKRAMRREIVKHQSASCNCIYAYASAGYTESTSDLVFSGHSLVAENGRLVNEISHFLLTDHMILADCDLGRIRADRIRSQNFGPTPDHYLISHPYGDALRSDGSLRRTRKLVFVPENETERRERCMEIFQMQVTGLKQRLSIIGCNAVIGISGGLDSTLALLVAVEAMKQLGRPATDVFGVTMPCFGTSDRTYTNSWELMRLLGISPREIPIREAVSQHFADIGHDPAQRNATYENAQARERTQILMDYASVVGGIVVGTGDLSELALGWCTYNGDHMSMYSVNADIPKTLIPWIIEAVSLTDTFLPAREVLKDVVDTPISPELLPPDAAGKISQQTEDLVGPYALHDFFLYHMLRFGFSPEKIYTLACRSFDQEYSPEVIKKWLVTFYRRFFSQQFKRNCLPDGVKVGSVGLGPRGDWKMPSDASVRLWLEEAERL